MSAVHHFTNQNQGIFEQNIFKPWTKDPQFPKTLFETCVRLKNYSKAATCRNYFENNNILN
jgi:hypothetical protein